MLATCAVTLGLFLLRPSAALRLPTSPRRWSTSLSVVSETGAAASAASFVQDELRPYAMKLHTRDQAPREGTMPAQKPFTKWEVTLSQYAQVSAR